MWRRLRRLGAVQVLDGLVALPADAWSLEQLEWVADEVTDAGGEAMVWTGRLTSAVQDRRLAGSMAQAAAMEYRSIIEQAQAGESAADADRRRIAARLRRQLRRVNRRDFFPPPERKAARQAVERLAAAAGVLT